MVVAAAAAVVVVARLVNRCCYGHCVVSVVLSPVVVVMRQATVGPLQGVAAAVALSSHRQL